jgi:hypothetical protein
MIYEMDEYRYYVGHVKTSNIMAILDKLMVMHNNNEHVVLDILKQGVPNSIWSIDIFNDYDSVDLYNQYAEVYKKYGNLCSEYRRGLYLTIRKHYIINELNLTGGDTVVHSNISTKILGCINSNPGPFIDILYDEFEELETEHIYIMLFVYKHYCRNTIYESCPNRCRCFRIKFAYLFFDNTKQKKISDLKKIPRANFTYLPT